MILDIPAEAKDSGHWPMVRIEGLTKKFDELTAVENLELEIRPGEVFGFLGPNGAGKTTTRSMLSALIDAFQAGHRQGDAA